MAQMHVSGICVRDYPRPHHAASDVANDFIDDQLYIYRIDFKVNALESLICTLGTYV